jgi:hypothetical protein
MLRRLLIIFALTLVPSTAALALAAPIITTTTNVDGALLDSVTKSTAAPALVRTQGILAYNITFHDNKYTYTVPLCADAQMLEQDGRSVDPINFIPNDTVAVALRPNVATDAKSCASRIVRQKIGSGSSQGECLQGFQVLHEVEGLPTKLVTGTEYTYVLSIYNRPTLDCDGKAYGSSPITTTVAPARPFIVYLDRDTPTGKKELMRWSITTNSGGTARIVYTFAAPSDTYKFHIMPGGTNTAGDLIGWSAKVLDSHPSPSPEAAAPVGSSDFRLTTAPIVAVLVLVLIVAAGAEYWYWVRKKRETESPEQEYQRTQRL